ncbi:MAG: C4-dicarboxylate ABC transporter, partial [Achromobacter mucicolens]
MKFRNLIGVALCAAAVVGMAPAHAQNYKPEYKLSIVVGTTFPWGQGAEIWSNLVRERTDGR